MNLTPIITFKNLTYAQKARRLLSREGIRANILKIDENEAKNGCTHGIEIQRQDIYAAIEALKSSGIRYSVRDIEK